MPLSTKAKAAPQAYLVNIPSMEYERALAFQRAIVADRIAGNFTGDVVLILEHPQVFTLGRRGGLDNLTVKRRFLQERGIGLVQVERGGDITFHGPGQLVIYPIIDLKAHSLPVVDFVAGLEEVMIRTAMDWGIAAKGDPQNRGVWIGKTKIGSIGITIRRGISFHGLAFNVNSDLTPFAWINPCGLKDIEVTSMAAQLGGRVSMEAVRDAAAAHLAGIFGLSLVTMALEDLESRLHVKQHAQAP
jgi:lipoate-protein ligase B